MGDRIKSSLADRDPGRRGSFFAAFSGLAKDVFSGKSSDVRGMLTAVYGLTGRGHVDTRAAAKDLGVSQRTVQRWIADDARQHNKPRREHLSKLQTKAKRAPTTKRGRRAAVSVAKQSAKGRSSQSRKGKLNVRGRQGVFAGRDGKKNYYVRYRTAHMDVNPDQMDAMWAAYADGGDKGLSTWLHEHSQDYVDDWHFESIDGIEWSAENDMPSWER